jgi:hypothetical protein
MKLSLAISVLAATFGSSAAQTLFEAIALAEGNYTTLLSFLVSSGAQEQLATLSSNISKYYVCIRSCSLRS